MIRVGFIGAVSKEWMGGLNYFNNLLFALNQIGKKELEIFVFVGKKIGRASCRERVLRLV